MNLSPRLSEFKQNDYHHFIESGCEYFQHKKSMHYYTICQRQNIIYIGTDVRNAELTRKSTEDILLKFDQDSSARVDKVKKLLTELKTSEITEPTFTVYSARELAEF